MVIYRVIRRVEYQNYSSATWFHYETLEDAYKQCIPSDKTDACRLLLNGVYSEIYKGQKFIRITCDRGDIWWIQLVENPSDALGPITTKIDCCHIHQ